MKNVIILSSILALSPCVYGDSITLEYGRATESIDIPSLNKTVTATGNAMGISLARPIQKNIELAVSHTLMDMSADINSKSIHATGQGTLVIITYEYPMGDSENILLGAGISHLKTLASIGGISQTKSYTDGLFALGVTSDLSEKIKVGASLSWSEASPKKSVNGRYTITDSASIGLGVASSSGTRIISTSFTHSF